MLGTAMKEAARDFFRDGAMTLAAAVAFYTALSFAPLVMLAMTVGGMLGHDTQAQMIEFFQRQAGPEASKVTDTVVQQARREQQSAGSWRWFVGIGVVVFSASTVFAQLQAALNRIWGVKARPGGGVWQWVRKRLLSMGMIFSILGILLASLLVSSFIQQLMPGSNGVVGQAISFATSIGVFTLLFAATFKILPDVRIAWRDVWTGAFVTALLFALGMLLISIYLQYAGVGKGFSQAAASVIALMVWAYYSAIVFFFGAEVTEHYARLKGSAIEPDRHAQRVEDRPRPVGRPGFRRTPHPA